MLEFFCFNDTASIFMKKLFAIIALSLLAFAFKPRAANADCQPLYGGGQSCTTNFSFTINKLVQVPGKGGGGYVDNLSINDPKYSPSENASYEVIVTNTGSQTIPTINVTDAFPQFITFVAGLGNYNKNTNTLTFTITNLDPGKSATYILTAKTADTNNLPNQGIICNSDQVTNRIYAVDSSGNADFDSSQVCIQKNVLSAVVPAPKIVTTPATGPEMLPLFGLIPAGLGGLLLRRKSNKTFFKGGEK